MLFELRNSVPEVSAGWVGARDLFLSGNARGAFEVAQQLRGQTSVETANDFLLNIEIARACAVHKTYMAIVRRAMRSFPEDSLIRLFNARILLALSRHTEGIDFLLECESTLGRTHRAYWGTELANIYAHAGFEKSCVHWLDAVQADPEFDSPLALYSRSGARHSLLQWDLAIELAERCINAAPGWSRVRGYLIHCLLARGRIDAAQEQITEAGRRGHQEAIIDMAAAMLSMSLGQFDEAKLRLEALLRDWPQADFEKWVRRTLCILLVERGDYEAARNLASGNEVKLALPKIPDNPGGRHRYIPLPLIAQSRHQCVPTSVAMAVHAQGHQFDPDVMFQEMHGREGTALWRMREWCQARGFRVVPIRLEKEAVTGMLEAGVPLIGSLEGPFNSHVDVVCGFNDSLDTLYVRDPGHWALVAWPWDAALIRYRMNAGLLAVIEAARLDIIAFAETWRSDECGALLDLAQAVAHGDRTAAEAAYARIADDSPAAAMRDGYAINVVISPTKFRERMKVVAQDESADAVARFRAAMALGSEDDAVLDKLLEADASDQFRAGARRYLQLVRLMNGGDWPAARTLVDHLLRRGGGVAQYWEMKSDILAELGQHEESRTALERAIELAPLRMSTREKALRRSAARLTLEEYAAELESFLAEDPSDKGLLVSRASLLQDGPDGLAYEEAAREAIRWFPRLPRAYYGLLNWYLVQVRRDLHDRLLSEARLMLPDIFADESKKQGASPSEPTAQKTEAEDRDVSPQDSALAPPETLPEEKEALLNLIWQFNDPRREAAVARGIELQDAGQLHWYETARLIACRLLAADRRGQEPAEPDTLLPDPPPGAPHWFADTLCDVLTDHEPSIRAVLAVDRWLVRTVPNYEDYAELWFNRVLLLERARKMEAALEELRKLLVRYPATSSALFRMGVVKYYQQDYPEARGYFEKALKVNPGLFGAMDMLRDVHHTLGQRAEALNYTRMLRRKMPYSVPYLRDEVLAVAELESVEAAEQLLQQAAGRYPPRRVDVVRARCHQSTGRLDEAARILATIELSPDDDDDAFEECLAAKLQVSQARGDSAETIAACDAGLGRWPKSTRLKEIKAETLAPSDPQQSLSLLREVLCEGESRSESAQLYLQLIGSSPVQAARELVQNAPEDHRQELAELFSQAMGSPDLLALGEPFMKWALGQFPESDTLRYRLISHYNLNGKTKRAVRLAKELYERNPESVDAARMLGRCLMDQNANKALPYLEQACQQNRSADFLFDLARCYQIVGLSARSIEIHWEILKQNPFVAASWTNLYLVSVSNDLLWPYLFPMLEQGCGLEDEYFLVAAVMIAKKMKRTLVPAWFPLAVQRWTVLQSRPGFRDERRRLRRALVAWQARRPSDVDNKMKLPTRVPLELAVARFRWPGWAWIPKD